KSQIVGDILRQRGWLSGGHRCFAISRAFVRGRRKWNGFPAQIYALFVIPGGVIVSARRGVKSGVQPILWKFEPFLNDERSVRVVGEIFFRDPVILDGVPNQPAEERNVGARANLKEQIGSSGRASES